MAKRTPYQDRIIKNYYRNQDSIMIQRLGELVTDLYLAEGKARAKVWSRITATLRKLEVPKTRIDHLVQSDDPERVAAVLKELLGK